MLRSLVKYNCGLTVPSSCVPFTGNDLTILTPTTQLSCDANLDDVIKAIDLQVKILMDGLDYTNLNAQCLTFTPATVTSKQLHQIEIDEICAARARLTTIETQLNNLNIGSQLVTVDLGCLTTTAGPCAAGTNTYTVQSLFNIIFSTLCQLLA